MIPGLATYVHNNNSSSVQFVHNPLLWDTNSSDEQCGLFLDDNVNQLGQFSTSVVNLDALNKLPEVN